MQFYCISVRTGTEEKYEKSVLPINQADVDIVIVCLGCPKQEYWIKKNIDKINTKIIGSVLLNN